MKVDHFPAFEIYLRNNPNVLRAFPKCINLIQRAGLGKFGFGFVLDWMRFHRDYRHMRVMVNRKEKDFCIPNSLHSYFLHALLIWQPDHRNLFEVQPSAGQHARPQIRALLLDLGFVKEMPAEEAKRILRVPMGQESLFNRHEPQPINLATGEI